MGEPKLEVIEKDQTLAEQIRQGEESARLEALEYENFKYRGSSHADEGEGNWLVSYADMMTLLVGFFVLLFSFSKIDASKFEQIKKETTKTFGGEYVVPFENVSKTLKDVVKDKGLSDQVFINATDDGIEIVFRGALFFDSGSSTLRQQAVDLLGNLVPTIIENAKDFGIVIEGHTDNRPIVGGVFPSNWELSSVRACSVLRFFLDKGFDQNKIKAIGWGDRKPVVPNEDPQGNPILENQSQNRRVVVKIAKNFE